MTDQAAAAQAVPIAEPFTQAAIEPFGARASYCGVPLRRADQVRRDEVVVLGAPLDWGTSYRPGARFGPRAIRDADYQEPDGRRPHLTAKVDPLVELPVVDAGDIPIMRGYLEKSLESIQHYVHMVAAAGGVPVILGGDHTITLANATAIAQVHGFGDVAVVHFDAHADTGVYPRPEMLGHGAPMRKLIESGAVPGHRFVQIGLRGYWPPPETLEWMRERRMRCYFMEEINQRGLDPVLDEAVAYVSAPHEGKAAKAVFVSVDVDVVDPGMAPGTGTPEPGGLTSRQMLDAMRRLGRELPVVGADVLEVAPVYDQPMNLTAMLAHRLVLELMTGMAERRRAAGNGIGGS